MKIELKGVQETLLIPLAARAFETKSKNPRIKDVKAVEMVSKIEYDFSKFDRKMSKEGVIARTMILDRETQKFVNEYPDVVCISIGCGLDTRYYRIRYNQVQWYNIDFPEVIALRKKLIYENKNVHFIGKSALDISWNDDIYIEDKKVLIIMEGLLMYFTEPEVIQLFCMIKNHFPNCTILVEIMHPFIAGCSKQHDTIKHTDAVFRWGTRSGKAMEKLCEGLHFVKEWNLFDELKSRGVMFRIAGNIPFIRNKNNKIVKLVLQ
ncbi:class I SAM-dependent methyltransferase [Lacrimispora sp. 38-1]|uniref:class I SAM-dependent methyltransferase n=1 Tax=Lacrimispora sp. 38-1 TaxID=3125778 RepID=UPI003CF79697